MTASVAGILGLVAQSINGIELLRQFVQNVRYATDTLSVFLERINEFQESLSQVQGLLVKLSAIQPNDTEARALQVLRSRVENCMLDIEKWLGSAANMDPGSSRGIESFFKKIRIARNKDGMGDFHIQVVTHQTALGMSLSVLGQYVVRYRCDYQLLIIVQIFDSPRTRPFRHIYD